MRFPQPRDLGRGGHFPTARMGGGEEGISLRPRDTTAQRPSESPGLSRSPLGHRILLLRDRPEPQGNEEGANPLPPGPRMRKFPCKCQADHRHRASHQGDKCKFLWRGGAAAAAAGTQRSGESLPHTLPRSGVSPECPGVGNQKGLFASASLVLTTPSPSSILLLFLLSDVSPGLSLLPRGSAQPLRPSPSSVPNLLLLYGLATPFSHCKSLAAGKGRKRA